uniref:Ig-like domain-containing protein n=1 Tax=Sinocyclocheilus anshuiensis TaxID=1608454 RepID=A0A671KKX1_9TELE
VSSQLHDLHPSLWWSRLPSLCLMYFLFIHLIFSAEGNIQLFQKPRFVGVKTGQTVKIYCVPSNLSLPAHVEWFKGQSYKDQLKNSQKITITEKSDKLNASITIKKVEIEDRGTYFCKLNGMLGPGTELQVSSSEPQAIFMRSRVKDVIIFLQALLLILCIVVPLVQIYKLVRATTFPQTFRCILCDAHIYAVSVLLHLVSSLLSLCWFTVG